MRHLRKGPARSGYVLTVGLAAIAGLAACGAGTQPDERAGLVVRDSAGVTIIDNGPLPPSEPVVLGPPVLEIGVVDGEPAYQLFRVTAAKRLTDGSVAVVNGGTREVRIYGADGEHRVTMGGAGQGPSEFRYPSGLIILPDGSLQVQDFLDRVVFTADGGFVRRTVGDRQALFELARTAGGFTEGGGWLADGRYFAPILEPASPERRPGPLFRPPMAMVRTTGDFETSEVLGEFDGYEQQYVSVGGPHGVTSIVPPYAAHTAWAAGAADGTLVVADNATPELHRFHPDGTHSIIRWSAPALPITAEDVSGWKAHQREQEWVRDRLPELERAWSVMDFPETKPYYDRVAVGSDGALWVTTTDTGPGTSMMVFDPDGSYRCTVHVPDPFRVLDSGPEWVLGVAFDEDDVESMRLYEHSSCLEG